MHPGQPDVPGGQHLPAALGVGEPDGPVPEVDPLLQPLPAAEEGDRPPGLLRQVPGQLVVIVEDGPVLLPLVEEDVLLGGDILPHGSVVVQVVGGQVGHYGDVGALLHGHQLEGGQLQHRKVLRLHAGHIWQQGLADIAPHIDVVSRLFQELRKDGGGGGLAVAARHTDQAAGAQAEEQLHLRGDLRPPGPGRLQGGVAGVQAGGAEDHVLIQPLQIRLPQPQPGSQALQLLRLLLHPLPLGPVAHGHVQIRPQQHPDQRRVADPHADHGDPLPPQTVEIFPDVGHGIRSFPDLGRRGLRPRKKFDWFYGFYGMLSQKKKNFNETLRRNFNGILALFPFLCYSC